MVLYNKDNFVEDNRGFTFCQAPVQRELSEAMSEKSKALSSRAHGERLAI